jgi:hypothetical protein
VNHFIQGKPDRRIKPIVCMMASSGIRLEAEQVMKSINVASYYKPKESEVLEDYLKAIESISISSDKSILTKQVAELKQKSKDSEYIIRGKLQEKDEQIKTLTEQFSSMQSMI